MAKRKNSPDRARGIAEDILEAFESGNVAEPLARVFINHGDLPMYGWSPTNRFLVLIKGMTDARAFGQWKDAKRSVKGQQAGAYIYRPNYRKETDEETGEEKLVLSGFSTLPVWDVSQTTGDPLPYMEVTEKFLAELPLREVAEKLGLELKTFSGERHSADGWFIPDREISLGVTNLTTWLHELIHMADMKLGNLVEQGQHWMSETVAELGATVLAHMINKPLEADTGGAWQYISTYANRAGIEPIDASRQALDRVIEAIKYIMSEAEME